MRNQKYLDLMKKVEKEVKDYNFELWYKEDKNYRHSSTKHYRINGLNNDFNFYFTIEENKEFTGYTVSIQHKLNNYDYYTKLEVMDFGNKITFSRDGYFTKIQTGYDEYIPHLMNADQIEEFLVPVLEYCKKLNYVHKLVDKKDIDKFRGGLKLNGLKLEDISIQEIDKIISDLPNIKELDIYQMFDEAMLIFCNNDKEKVDILKFEIRNKSTFIYKCQELGLIDYCDITTKDRFNERKFYKYVA